jgi:hypothetical protein
MNGPKLQDRRPVRLYLLAIVAGCGLGSLFATAGVKVVQSLTGEDALRHLNETNTVCGTVASARFLEEAPGNPTYLNLDHPYPNQSCAAVIAGAARPRFKVAPEKAFMGKWVCVTGLITTNSRGRAEIAVTDPTQIVAQDAPYTPTNQTAAPPTP